MNARQKIIIQSFGLTAVETAIYSGAIDGLVAVDAIRGPGNNQYKGIVPPAFTTPDEPVASSQLGTPVWDNLIIAGGNYTDSTFGPIHFGDFRLDTVLITLNQVNNVILTPIQGRDGEVIEYVGKMSFRLNVKGGVFGHGNIRPKSDIANLNAVLNSNAPLVVKSSKFLDEWDISEFVILDKNLPQIAGGYNYQLFEFNAIQNTPVILAQKQSA